MELDDHSRELLIAALLERGWRFEADLVMSPKKTMWLSRETPWHGELADMLERMQARLERVRRFVNDEAATEEWRETFDDTRSLVDVLEELAAAQR